MNTFDPRKGLFEVNNARTQSRDEVVNTFVPPDSFWRLLSAKNHILQGSRGSGKTAVIRMLAHDHLSKFNDRQATKIISSKSFVGTYIPMRAEWVGTLKNKPWQTESEKELWFRWRLNVSACNAFIETMRSCVESYVTQETERAIVQRKLAQEVGNSWAVGKVTRSFDELHASLEDIEWMRQVAGISRAIDGSPSTPGAAFEVELFAPLRRAVTVLKRFIQFDDRTVWGICLDEIEFLEPLHHRILNTHLRSAGGELAYKFTTQPYFHHTLDTNVDAQLKPGDDFEYVYLDHDPIWRGTDKSSWMEWAEAVLDKRLKYASIDIQQFSFATILGDRTPLLDDKDSDWGDRSPMMAMLKRFSTPETWDRALALSGTSKFNDQISRKMHSMLLLRDARERYTGNAVHELYGGPKMVVRCSDANPRQLFRIFNELVFRNPSTKASQSKFPIHHPSLRDQTRVMVEFSKEALAYVACEESVGGRLSAFLTQLCEYFQQRFYASLLSTDYFYAISVEPDIDDETWNLIRHAVGLGLLFPATTTGGARTASLPERSGVFNLAFRLAPAFGLLPRRGRPISLKTVLTSPLPRRQKIVSPNQYSLPSES